MKGNWHVIALSAFFSVMALKIGNLAICITFLLIWLIYLYINNKITIFIVLVSSLSFFFFYNYFPSYETEKSTLQTTLDKPITLRGKIISQPNHSDKKLSFTLREDKFNRNVLVTFFYNTPDVSKDKSEQFPYYYGATCQVSGTISTINQPSNPFEFDYKKYLYEQGIDAQITVPSLEQIKCESNRSFLQQLQAFRQRLLEKSNESLHPDVAAWQQALIFGNREYLDDRIESLFQRWGLSHLLAISGLHVGIIVIVIYFIMIRILQVTKEKAQFVIILFLPMYAVIAGSQPSVWRASLMILIMIIIKLTNTKLNYTDILSIVFLLLISANKYLIYHVGFQFSFAVTLGLLLSEKWFLLAKTNIERIFQISFIAQMMIVPLQMYYFYHFQPLSILLNVVIVPYFSLIVIPVMFLSFLIYSMPSFIVTIFEKLFLSIHHSIIQLITIVDEYVNVPFVSGEITLLIAIVYYFFLFLMMIHLERNNKKKAFQYGLAVCLVLTFIISKPYFSKQGLVTMLDIGQGDAFIIELPYRKGVFLIDAGSTFDFKNNEPNDSVYKRVIRPYLMGRGIQTIDGIFVSHAHLDHHGSIRFIIDEYNVKELFIHQFYDDTEKELNIWLEKVTQITTVNFLEKITRNGHDFFVLAPRTDRNDENNNSLVLYTHLGNDYWLFTGDISKEVELEIVNSFENLHIDILKIAHHGSNTSTAREIIEQIKPSYAFIPVGKGNRYGHPTKEVIETLSDFDVEIYRTDENGAVRYEFAGNKTAIIPYMKR